MKYKNIFFCTADPTKNAGHVRSYFIENTQNFVVYHFFPGYTDEFSYMEKFSNGKKVLRKTFSIYKGKNAMLRNIFYFIYFAYTLLVHVQKGSFLIINAPFFCMFSFVFKFLKGFRYVLWIGDYYPSRNFPMNIYHALVDHYNAVLEYVTYLSPPLKQIYSNKHEGSKKFREIISLGISKQFSQKHTLNSGKLKVGFIGIIRNQQGLDLFFKYLANSEDCLLEIVGNGYSLPYYKNMAKKLGIEKKVKFYGKVDDIEKIFNKWDLGIALYENTEDNLSRYCEPTKIKDYLSFGLPVITTRTTYFNKEIKDFHAGIVINEDINSVGNAVKAIKNNYLFYQDGVSKLLAKYEYAPWYDKHFKFLTQDVL
jgi:glycosyltransferase involved in cell wall biosynthesis